MKAIPLIKANLKGFVRNWKSIFLLIVLPLIMITLIFLSFSPDGLRKIEIGYSLAHEETLDQEEFEGAISSFAKLTQYEEIEHCIDNLERYQEYVCVEISGKGPYVLDIHYDNTREPVIWEIIERIKQAVQLVQKEQSRTIAADFLTSFRQSMERLESYEGRLGGIHYELEGALTQVDRGVTELYTARSNLLNSLTQMDQDIAEAKMKTSNARYEKDQSVGEVRQYLRNTEDVLDMAPAEWYVSSARTYQEYAEDSVNDLDRDVEQELNEIDQKLYSYDAKSRQGRIYADEISSEASNLARTKQDLRAYQRAVLNTVDELEEIKEEFRLLEDLDAETLVNPVVLKNRPTYIPGNAAELQEKYAREDESKIQQAARGVSLISLQTIFPTLLLLITLFLSLLISSFITLSEINSKAHMRIQLVQGIFFNEFIATFTSSLMIIFIPVLIVVLIGEALFRLGIFARLWPVLLLLLMVMAVYILLGLLLAYLIRKESMTLMASTFLLIIILFFSGFLLPIERMSPFFEAFAELNPATLALSGFKQLVFYNQPVAAISWIFAILAFHIVIMLVFTLLIKLLRK